MIAKKKIILCSPPRTASNFLVKLMWYAKFGQPREYFHTDIENEWRKANGIRHKARNSYTSKKYLENVLQQQSGNGVFSTKLQYWQLMRLVRSKLDNELFQNASIVFLQRDNILDQAISDTAARLSLNWDHDPELSKTTTKISTSGLKRMFLERLEFLAREDFGLRAYFAFKQIEPLRIRTEELIEDPTVWLCEIATLVGIELGNLSQLAQVAKQSSRYQTDLDIKARLLELVENDDGFRAKALVQIGENCHPDY